MQEERNWGFEEKMFHYWEHLIYLKENPKLRNIAEKLTGIRRAEGLLSIFRRVFFMKLDRYDVKRREEIMSNEEIRLAEQLIKYYVSSWQDKSRRGLFDLWEKVESYWEGNPRLPESENDPNSNINFVHPNVEGQVALLMEQNIAVSASPSSPSDAPFAGTVQTVLEWIKDKNKLMRKLDVHERRREKFGTGIFRVLYDPDAVGGFGMPVIEACNPAYVFVDPNITDVYKINDGAFVIETLNKPISWARKRFGSERADIIRAGFHPSEDFIFGESVGENYIHILAWIRTNGHLRLVQMSGCGVILDDRFHYGERFPYFFTPLYSREGVVWAKGDAELLLPLQDLVDDLDDQIRINARLSGNPQRIVDISSNIDLDKWTNESGLIIPTNNINGVKYLVPPEMPAYPMQRRELALQFERQMLTRFADNMTGQKTSGVRTATEAAGLQRQGDLVIGHKKVLLQETLAEVFEYCLELIKEYYTEEKSFRVGEDFLWFRGSDLKKVPQLIPGNKRSGTKYMRNGTVTKDAKFDIVVTVGAGLPGDKMFMRDFMLKALEKGAISTDEMRKWIERNIGFEKLTAE